MTHLDKMILRLYVSPLLLLVAATIAQHMAYNLVETGKANMMAGIIANSFAPLAYRASIGLLAWAALWKW